MKYPRTYHLPFSPGKSNDDKVMHNISCLLNKPLVITEKMDGSNVSLSLDNCFARSHSGSPNHPSFDQLKSIHASIKYIIPKNVSIYGEWLYAKHSIYYDSLPAYLMIFAARYADDKESAWYMWPTVETIAENLGLLTVPVIEKNKYFASENELETYILEEAKKPSLYGEEREGLVIRTDGGFVDEQFQTCIAKYVRKNHVQTDEHWKHKQIEKNGLKLI
jgi:hypothetical protein